MSTPDENLSILDSEPNPAAPAQFATNIGRRKWLAGLLAGPAVVALPRTASALGSIATCADNFNGNFGIKYFTLPGQDTQGVYRTTAYAIRSFKGSPTNIKKEKLWLETRSGRVLDCDYEEGYWSGPGILDRFGDQWKVDEAKVPPVEVNQVMLGVVDANGEWVEADATTWNAMPVTQSCWASIGWTNEWING